MSSKPQIDIDFSTPELGELAKSLKEYYYPPSEDTYLLLDALQIEFSFIKYLKPYLCLEVGCGSGIVICFLSRLLGQSALYFSTDINIQACLAAHSTSEHNHCIVNLVCTDLIGGLYERFMGLIDILIFNPPYVPTPVEEISSKGIEASWAGGYKGRVVLDRLLLKVGHLLSPIGIFYLVTADFNIPGEIINILNEQNFKEDLILERKLSNESLKIFKFSRK